MVARWRNRSQCKKPQFLGAFSWIVVSDTSWTTFWNFGGADGARTRDPRRDRPVF